MAGVTDQFDRFRLKGFDLYLNKDFPSKMIDSLIQGRSVMDGRRGPFESVPASKYARVYKCPITFSGRTHYLFLKRFLYRSFCDFIKHLFRPSRAKRSLNASILLQQNDLNCPQIIATGEHRPLLLCSDSFIITRELTDSHCLYHYLLDEWNMQNPPAEILRLKRSLIKQLGRTIGRMHEANIFHGDLRLGNIFAKHENDQWQFSFIDNERTAKALPFLSDHLRIKNLVQMNLLKESLTRTDRLRFFIAYMKTNSYAQKNSSDLIKKVLAKTRLRHNKM